VLGVVVRGRRAAAAGGAGAERAACGWLRRSAGAAQARVETGEARRRRESAQRWSIARAAAVWCVSGGGSRGRRKNV